MAASTTRNLFLQVSANTDGMVNPLRAAKTAMLNWGGSVTDVQREVRTAFDTIGGDGIANAGRRMEQQLQAEFTRIKSNARAVMDAPTPQAAIGIVNAVGADRDASAAETKAAGFRIAADAAAAAAAKTGELSVEHIRLAAALEASAVAAEREAATLRAQATLMGGVHAEMIASGAIVESEAGKVEHAHSRMGASGMILQHVMRSTTDSFAAGLPVSMILGEQIGRLGEAASLAGDSMGKFGKFMGGPWGLAIGAAISVGSALASTLMEGGSAAEADAKSHDALKEAVDRLNESSNILAHTTALGIAEDVRKSEALRDREIQTRRLIQAELELAQANARQAAKRSVDPTLAGEGGFNAGAVAQRNASSEASDLAKQVAEQDRKIGDAQKAIRVGHGKLIARRVEEENDPKTANRNRYDDRVDWLGRRHDRGLLSDADYGAGLTKAANDRDAGDEALKTHRTRKPKVDHTVQREANADRAYTAELQAAQSRAARAQLGLADTAEARWKVETDDLETARKAKNAEIADQLKAGKFGQAGSAEAKAKAAALIALNDQATALEKQAATTKEQQSILDRQLNADRQVLDDKMALLRLQATDAVGSGQKRGFALRLLAGEEDRARLDAKRDMKSTDPEVAKKGAAALKRVDDEHDYRVRDINDQNRDPLQSYGEQLRQNVGDMNDALKNVQADGLRGVEDGLLGVLSGTKSAAQGFKEMASSIIADLERIAIEKLILAFIPGLKGGGAVDDIPGFADGGSPSVDRGVIRGPGTGTSDSILATVGNRRLIRVANGEGIVNARAMREHRDVFEALNAHRLPAFASGGAIDGSRIFMRALPSAASIARPMVVQQTFAIDAKGSILANDLMTAMQEVSSRHAQAAMVGGAHLAQSEMAENSMGRIPI